MWGQMSNRSLEAMQQQGGAAAATVALCVSLWTSPGSCAAFFVFTSPSLWSCDLMSRLQLFTTTVSSWSWTRWTHRVLHRAAASSQLQIWDEVSDLCFFVFSLFLQRHHQLWPGPDRTKESGSETRSKSCWGGNGVWTRRRHPQRWGRKHVHEHNSVRFSKGLGTTCLSKENHFAKSRANNGSTHASLHFGGCSLNK